MAIINGKEVKALYLGGEKYVKALLGSKITFTKYRVPLSTTPMGGGEDGILEPGTTATILATKGTYDDLWIEVNNGSTSTVAGVGGWVHLTKEGPNPVEYTIWGVKP